ncbi:hypothetical protein [Massilia endophytica]|uniref:hypothetical protein n=1 Tax=Massilia endophytica TaxID=2899220 RepID=UPI001E5F5FC1|nr:hypothetical protein [Massilia endophytica]UGQ44787.1 hypothetical protein LSQ66_13355 [Massilia endophytica]
MRYLSATFVSIAGLVLAAGSLAQDLVLDCSVKRTDPDGSQYEFVRRLELTFDSSTVAFYDNFGRGFDFSDRYRFVRADAYKIQLRNDQEAISYVDRTDGNYFFKRDDGMVIRGNCVARKAGAVTKF